MMVQRRAWSLTFLVVLTVWVMHPAPRRGIAGAGEQNPSPRENRLQLALPSELIAVTGLETNVYFDNVVLCLNRDHYAFDAVCSKGRQQSERWTWTPTADDVGEHPFEIIIRDSDNQTIASGKLTIHVVAKSDLPRTTSLLLVGDSLTHASVYSRRLLDLSAGSDQPRLKLIGSHQPDPNSPENRHEGYGGWTAHRFATHFAEQARQGEYSQRGSPFLYRQQDESAKLDFAQYCRDVNDNQFPDVVTIFLGPNDIFAFNDDTISAGIESMLTHYDQLIEMVRTTSPATKIGVVLPVPPAASQDAFGSNYASGQTRWQYKRNQHALLQAMLHRYEHRKSEQIHIVGAHLNLDTVHNYPTETVAPNIHADQKVVRQNNGVHPSPAGYRQIGDSLYAWLLSL